MSRVELLAARYSSTSGPCQVHVLPSYRSVRLVEFPPPTQHVNDFAHTQCSPAHAAELVQTVARAARDISPLSDWELRDWITAVRPPRTGLMMRTFYQCYPPTTHFVGAAGKNGPRAVSPWVPLLKYPGGSVSIAGSAIDIFADSQSRTSHGNVPSGTAKVAGGRFFRCWTPPEAVYHVTQAQYQSQFRRRGCEARRSVE